MPATTKTELLDVTLKEYAKLQKLVVDLPAEPALQKREEDTSIKDVIGHRAHWIDLFLGWYTDGQAGKTVFFPAKDYKWNELKSYNANLRDTQKDLSWDDAKELLDKNHKKLLAFINNHTQEQLYGGPMQGANNAWTPGRWAEAAGPSHFRSAGKFIRAALRSDS